MRYTLVKTPGTEAHVQIVQVVPKLIGKVNKAGGVTYSTYEIATAAQRRMNFASGVLPLSEVKLQADCLARGSFSGTLFFDSEPLFIPAEQGESNIPRELDFYETRSEVSSITTTHKMSGGTKYINIDRTSLVNSRDTQRMRFTDVDELRDLQIVLKEMIESIENT